MYRIKRKRKQAAVALVPATIRVCVDVRTNTVIELTMSPEQDWRDQLSVTLETHMERLVRTVPLQVGAPVILGGPGIYRKQLAEQIMRGAFVCT